MEGIVIKNNECWPCIKQGSEAQVTGASDSNDGETREGDLDPRPELGAGGMVLSWLCHVGKLHSCLPPATGASGRQAQTEK